jgi:TetR/AcrR family transcriptional regulator of autoinduction and epiphytic fitness
MSPMKTEERPPTRSELKRAAIIDAAAYEFREAGFAATSMDRIADRARVSKRTVYNHFANKEALFEAILEVLWTRAHAAVDVEYDPRAELSEQLAAIARRKLDVVADPNYLGLARALMGEAIRSPGFLQSKWSELSELEGGLTRWIHAATEDGRLAVDEPAFAAEQFAALLKSFAFWPQVAAGQPTPSPEERKAIITEAVAMFLARYQTV